MNPLYLKCNYKTPDVFKNKYTNKSCLIIATGPSTKYLIPYKNKLKKYFDVIIGLNYSTRDFEDILDFHMIMEKEPKKAGVEMKSGDNYRRDLPRIFNWKAICHFPKDLNIYKATRNYYNGNYNIKEYKIGKEEGFIIGPQERGLSVGTVLMQGIHFASILGCKKIYLSGANLLFLDEGDHYYKDRLYRDSQTKKKNRSPIISVEHNGKKYETTAFFHGSAKFIDDTITKHILPIGIEVFDFSDGLLKSPKKIKLEEFFK